MNTQMDESGGSDAATTTTNNNISAAPADNANGTDAAGPSNVGNGNFQGPESGAQPGDDVALPDASSGAGGDANDGTASNAGKGSGNGTVKAGFAFGNGAPISEEYGPVSAREPSPSASAPIVANQSSYGNAGQPLGTGPTPGSGHPVSGPVGEPQK